jgi:hypothetical protein
MLFKTRDAISLLLPLLLIGGLIWFMRPAVFGLCAMGSVA